MSATAWPHKNTVVERLTIRCQGTADEINATTLRLRVERLLEMADLQPAGLPSGTVFIVRKLESPDPLPIAALAYSSLPDWREAVRGQVQALYTAAARPFNGSISPGAASVLFNDAGELLTCLTHDLLAGDARQRWYWQPFLRGIPHPTGTALATLWSNQASVVPTVLASLTISEATSAITMLSPGEVFSVTRALHTNFDLPSQALAALQNIPPNAQRAPQDVSSASTGAYETLSAPLEGEPFLPDERLERLVNPAIVQPPWRRWLANASTASLTPQAHYVLGLSLSLCHTPAFARSTAFAQRTVSWLHALTAHVSVSTSDRAGRLYEVLKDDRASRSYNDMAADKIPSAQALKEVIPAENGAGVPHDTSGMVLAEPTEGAEGDCAGRPDYEVADDDTPPMQALAEVIPAESGADLRRGVAKGDRESRSYHDTAGDSRPLPMDGLPTALGGILYLLHLLTWLNLPGGWDDDGAFAEGMSGWAIVEALARGLSDTWLTSYIDDPIWQLLAMLDGREPGESLGSGLPRQTAFRLPVQWLLHFVPPAPTWLAIIDDDHLRIIDADGGYLVVDVLLSGRSLEEAILAEVEAYRSRGIDVRWRLSHIDETGELTPFVPLSPAILASMSESSAWWLERVLGFLHYFIARRLGDPAFDAGQLAPVLFERPGQLIASRTHIDLQMAMDQISLPIRRAGFDRDPGWMPDLRRIVLFHFD
jgi:hypothetical protein